MTYRVAFIILPDELKSKIQGLQYMGSPYNWEYDAETDTWFALYGWTSNKQIMKDFKKQRNSKLFKYKKIKTKDGVDLREYKLEPNLEIERHEYISSNKKDKEKIVSTGYEHETSCDEQIVTEIFMNSYQMVDPLILNRDLQKILESIGYSYMFFSYSDIVLSEDSGREGQYSQDLADRFDLFWNNYSYKDMDTGQYVTENSLVGNSIFINEFNAFLYLFGILFEE